MMEISFRKLTQLFPKDTMWVDGCAEIIGYSPKENLHIVIDDGCCCSITGKYLVHKYKPSNPEEHFKNWNHGEYPWKYIGENKIFEERVDFNDIINEELQSDVIMKELSTEQKAKAYDNNYKVYTELINRLEDVKEAIKNQNYGIAMDVLCKPYPQFQITTSTEPK